MLIGRGVIGIGVSSISVADSIDSWSSVQTLTEVRRRLRQAV